MEEEFPEFRAAVGDMKFVDLTPVDLLQPVHPDVRELLEDLRQELCVPAVSLRVLDFGCGRGALVGQLRRLGYQAYGIDVDPRFVAAGAGLLADSPGDYPILSCGGPNGRTVFEPAFFDLIVSDQVLEHVSDLKSAIAEMVRILKPGGTMLHIFPAKYAPVEVHYHLPLVHWLPKGRLRKIAIGLLVRAGLGVRFQVPCASRPRAQSIYCYSAKHTFYRSRNEIKRAFSEFSVMLDFESIPRMRFGRKLAPIVGKGVASRLSSHGLLLWGYTTFRACCLVGKKPYRLET